MKNVSLDIMKGEMFALLETVAAAERGDVKATARGSPVVLWKPRYCSRSSSSPRPSRSITPGRKPSMIASARPQSSSAAATCIGPVSRPMSGPLPPFIPRTAAPMFIMCCVSLASS